MLYSKLDFERRESERHKEEKDHLVRDYEIWMSELTNLIEKVSVLILDERWIC